MPEGLRIPPLLKEAYKDGRCAVFVGAGASMGAGLPSWWKFLSDMVDDALEHGTINETRANEYRLLLNDSSKYLLVAASLKHDTATYFSQFVRKSVIEPKPQPTKLHESLTRAKLIQFVITTNYDTLIEKAYRNAGLDDVTVCTFEDIGELHRSLSKRDFFILKAHGDATKSGNTIILTENDYRDIIYTRRAYQSLLSAAFTMYSIIFVGASMSDPDVKLLLGYISDSFSGTSGPVHYALIEESKINETEKTRWLKDFNLNIISISDRDNYIEIPEFFDALHASTTPDTSGN